MSPHTFYQIKHKMHPFISVDNASIGYGRMDGIIAYSILMCPHASGLDEKNYAAYERVADCVSLGTHADLPEEHLPAKTAVCDAFKVWIKSSFSNTWRSLITSYCIVTVLCYEHYKWVLYFNGGCVPFKTKTRTEWSRKSIQKRIVHDQQGFKSTLIWGINAMTRMKLLKLSWNRAREGKCVNPVVIHCDILYLFCQLLICMLPIRELKRDAEWMIVPLFLKCFVNQSQIWQTLGSPLTYSL